VPGGSLVNLARLYADGAGPSLGRLAAAVLGLAGTVALVAACGSGGLTNPGAVSYGAVSTATPTTSPPPSGPYSTAGTYSDSAPAYLTNCEQNGSTTSFCQCTLNWFETNIAYRRFVSDLAVLKRYEQGQTGQLPADAIRADAACMTSGS
jgi:hypothetical protein